MMVCPACGRPVSEEDAFCSSCGVALPGAVAVAPPPIEASPPPEAPAEPWLFGQAPPMPNPSAAGSFPPAETTGLSPAITSAAPFGAEQNVPSIPLAPPAVPPRKLKTTTDMVLGIVFLVMGLATAVIYCFYLYRGNTLSSLKAFLPLLDGINEKNALLSITPIGNVIGILAGLLLFWGGLLALINGRGRKPAYSSVTAMLFVLCFDILYLVLLYLLQYTHKPLAEVILASSIIYGYQLFFVIIVSIALAVKQGAKRKALAALRNGPPPMPPQEENPPTQSPI